MQTVTIPQAAPLTKTVRMIPAKPEFAEQNTAAKTLRVAAYCRVSTEKDEQHLSYEAQRDFYTDKIMKNTEWHMAGIYADKGITGTIATKRTDFMRMIRDCKKGKIDLIITKAVQRFARNTVDSLEHVRMLKSLGIGVIFETQGLDTRKMTNEFMLTMYAGMAQNESENISANVKWGKQKSAARGNVAFCYKTFIGYRKGKNGKPEIDPEQAPIIMRIYNSFIAGQSLRDIADSLTVDSIPTAKGKAVWTPEAVKSILRNEKYCGDVILQKTFVMDCINHRSKVNIGELPQYYVENNHPAIIDKLIWNRVQEELARRGSKRKVKDVGTKTEQGKYSSKYALTELLVCGNCGKPYRRCTWSRNGQKKIVWRCISRLDYGKKYCTNSPTLEESVIQTAILGAFLEQAKTVPAALEILKRHIGMGLSSVENDDDPYTLQARIAELDCTIDELIELEAQEDNCDTYDDQLDSLCNEKFDLKEKLARIRVDNAHTSTEMSRLDEIFTVVDGIRNHTLEWDEQIIRQMIECVRVIGKDRIKINFRFGIDTEVGLTY